MHHFHFHCKLMLTGLSKCPGRPPKGVDTKSGLIYVFYAWQHTSHSKCVTDECLPEWEELQWEWEWEWEGEQWVLAALEQERYTAPLRYLRMCVWVVCV